MPDYSQTNLWRSALAPNRKDTNAAARERLRAAYVRFRERSALLAGEIARDLPDFTVHDVTHLDALWEMADLVLGEDFAITPAEAFVLGGAILIHDLGMGVASYPEGPVALRNTATWRDTAAALMRKKNGRSLGSDGLSDLPAEIVEEATATTLRVLHAKHAEKIALVYWTDEHSGERLHLLDDADLRRVYGPVIGKIAHSHWWSVSALLTAFPAALGAPPGFPAQWTVDPLKLACILRAADAIHLDARRAPYFLRVLRKPKEQAALHWVFQEHMLQPQRVDDRLQFTSAYPFQANEAGAWWIGYDALRTADRELRDVDALLADTGRTRFAIRAVVGAEDPSRLSQLIATHGWLPIDARVRVNDVANVVRQLGGGQLYGQDLTVPLRELIQNASDAVRARRCVEERSDDWGEITVRVGKDADGVWIEVSDSGIGMSKRTLAGPFLDFGQSYWGTTMMSEEWPGLMAKGFSSIGTYGIGFFSAFMWGDRVRVITRKCTAAYADTLVLEFAKSLEMRPLLREAHEEEHKRDGGTTVRVWLRADVSLENIKASKRGTRRTFKDVCAWLCPALDVRLTVEENGALNVAVEPSDWISMPALDLLSRVAVLEEKDLDPEQLKFAGNMRHIRGQTGAIAGRACIYTTERAINHRATSAWRDLGVISVGGFRSTRLSHIAGILVGVPQRASRDVAKPIVAPESVRDWASEQAELALTVTEDLGELYEIAKIVAMCGGNTGLLPIGVTSNGMQNHADVAQWAKHRDEIIMASYPKLQPRTFHPNVISTHPGTTSLIQTEQFNPDLAFWPGALRYEPPSQGWWFTKLTLSGRVIEAVAHAWGMSLSDLLEQSDFSTDDHSFSREIGQEGGEGIIDGHVDILRRLPKE